MGGGAFKVKFSLERRKEKNNKNSNAVLGRRMRRWRKSRWKMKMRRSRRSKGTCR